MSFTRPARCLFCRFSRAASTVPRMPRRQFHPSPPQFSDRKPKIPNEPVQEGKTLEEISRNMKPEDFKPYSEEEKAVLREHYTPEQMEAVEAGESAIDPKDMAEQFAIRRDPMKLRYLDDLSVIEPGVDKHVRAPKSNSDYNATLKTDEDFLDDFARFFAEMPENATAGDWIQFLETMRMTKGKEENELNPHSAMVPDLFSHGETLSGEKPERPRIFELERPNAQNKESDDMTDALKQLLLATGYSVEQIRALKTKTLVVRSVANQTRLGIGEAKSDERQESDTQSRYRAIRNMQPVRRYEDRTIFGDVKGKVGAVELKLMTRPPGFGLRCQHLIYEMCRVAGIHDLAARVGRSRNPMNTVKATFEALKSQRDPEEIARARGKKLVDVRKVYYSGRA
ncbi:hypothetical protein EYZ11_007688 [Aspergillus tanneri]|uniref:Small ribosomal subunit protein uS5 C-terminal domain-containing protein n=1 Tax=Aspergillus tanneri TaxID=1220188 RepID=A0A4S3JCE0_9EURO|nr:hypothetical protein EYZ11_007688 [Aspergillus tanneri]